ncbi:MAG TPA: hypothetical protein VM253_00945 [Candidatus Limnocylindrales bacterium]|nr:hypothetical protein [Candidatus Limnocylindrales bacterium]
MRRPILVVPIVVVGLLLLLDYLVVNESIGAVAEVAIQAAILVAAGAALAAVVALGVRRGGDLWRRRGDPVGAVLVLVGIGAMLVAGLRPGAGGAGDPAVGWMLSALLVPIGASLFGLLFVTTLAAARRSLALGSREATVLVAAAAISLVLLLPLGGTVGGWLADTASWALAIPIGAVFRGLLLGIAIVAAVVAARTLLGVGSTDG